MNYKKIHKQILADFYTPVSLFMRVRQKYHQALLLESSDYSSREDSQSFICFDALEGIILENGTLIHSSGESRKVLDLNTTKLVTRINDFKDSIKIQGRDESYIFGFSAYETVRYYEDIKLNECKKGDDTPDLRFDFYRFILKFDHFFETLAIIEHIPEGDSSQIKSIEQLINYQHTPAFDFRLETEETSNISGDDFKQNIRTVKDHLKRGDIFQLVLSRSFEIGYKGDVFNVYRSLRSVNPSPYLYFFDYGSYKIFGSSPEAQIVINNRLAEIHPIAGTVRRSGNYDEDMRNAESLSKDPKENAEHVMLVDLARNDLSIHSQKVRVKKYKEVQFFSHVIHLTSVVEGELKSEHDAVDVFADTFPAGTLSGAPKYKAMQIIDNLESTKRGFYGGAIGMMGLNGDINMAILIRSFLASNNTLRYQAGAGIVIDSNEESELQEVNNKLAALKKAIINASNQNL